MKAFAIAVIDGTGEWSNTAYQSAMQWSFCRQLGRLPNTHYERGPSGEGYRIRERAVRAADFLEKQSGKKLALAGYSRGASAAVIAAAVLQQRGVALDCLFLFDPVARHLSGDSSTVTGNVRHAWIARRKIGAPEMDKYDFSLLGDPAGHNPVRNWFGTTATKAESGVMVQQETFLGSHGALGGVGWNHVKEDPVCQASVARFMNQGLATAGVSCRLVSRSPH